MKKINLKNIIVVTGGSGRFGKVLKKKTNKKYLFPSKKELNILKINSIIKYLEKKKPKYLIHLAGLYRPMLEHENNIKKSIQLNIIGTSNLVIACSQLKIKIIYYSILVIKNLPFIRVVLITTIFVHLIKKNLKLIIKLQF